jgi:hypothetical protein
VLTADPALLAKEVRSLVDRLRLWTPARWAAHAEPWATRAELGRHLASWLADAAAIVEGTGLHDLPVLKPDLLVADQIAVTGDDLVRSEPPADLCTDAVAHLLAHRFDLLGEDVPASLGGWDTLSYGRTVCSSSLS